jgi:hypothetical protein
MSDPAEVKRVLARLATGDTGEHPAVAAGDDYRTVIDAATDAVESLADAAAFVEADGHQRLADAIEAADAADDHPAARRGRRAEDELDDLAAALDSAGDRGTATTEEPGCSTQ